MGTNTVDRKEGWVKLAKALPFLLFCYKLLYFKGILDAKKRIRVHVKEKKSEMVLKVCTFLRS